MEVLNEKKETTGLSFNGYFNIYTFDYSLRITSITSSTSTTSTTSRSSRSSRTSTTALAAALFLRQQSWIISWSYLALMGSLLHLMFAILAFIFFYEFSISQHKNYGRFVKAIFDLHRGILARSLGIEVKEGPPVSRQQSENEKALWKKYQNYYLDYRFIE
jgi:hypothetical protein